MIGREGEDAINSIDPDFFIHFPFLSIDFDNPKLNANGQPALTIKPRREEDLGNYYIYYLYQEIDSFEAYKVEAFVDIILTPNTSKDADLEEVPIFETDTEFQSYFGPFIDSISSTGLIELKFNSGYKFAYTKDLRERLDLFEVSITNDHKFSYTYEAKTDKILLIQLNFEEPTEVSVNPRNPDEVTINIKVPQIILAKGTNQPVSP